MDADPTMLFNVAAYSAQVACIAVLGTLVAALVRVDAPAVRYAYWRVLLALCLALPWLQRLDPAPSPGATVTSSTTTAVVVAGSAASSGVQESLMAWLPAIGLVLAGGAVLRLLWIGIGLMRLRRLRSAGEPADPCEAHDELQRALGTRAEIRYVAGLGQPVTFGTHRPLVLLPMTLRESAPAIERAVLCHELFHVQRRDWLWVLAEEVVRAALWFHPGVWWMISRIQLAREEVVDELTVLATGRRRAYIEALLAFADGTPLAPAAAFSRRRQLFRRMVLISKEAVMSSRRVVLSCAVMALVVLGGAWYAVRAFPLAQAPDAQILDAPGPVELRAKPITPENPIPRRIYAAPVLYPQSALGSGARGLITLRITLNELGRVVEIRRLGVGLTGGNSAAGADAFVKFVDAFGKAAADAVRLWVYDAPADGPIAFNVGLSFTPDSEAVLVRHDADGFNAFAPARVVEAADALRAARDRAEAAAAGGRPPAPVGRAGAAGGRFGAVGGRSGAPNDLTVAPPPPPPPPPPGGAVRVGGAIMAPQKVKNVAPVYPAIAQSAKVQGVVIVELRIEPNGLVSDARIIRSIPLLDQAALDAVKQWEFTPTLLNGAPVAVVMTATVNFSLAQ